MAIAGPAKSLSHHKACSDICSWGTHRDSPRGTRYLLQRPRHLCIQPWVTSCERSCAAVRLSTNRDHGWAFLLPQLHLHNSSWHLQGITRSVWGNGTGAHRSVTSRCRKETEVASPQDALAEAAPPHTPPIAQRRARSAKVQAPIHQRTCASTGTRMPPSPPAGNLPQAPGQLSQTRSRAWGKQGRIDACIPLHRSCRRRNAAAHFLRVRGLEQPTCALPGYLPPVDPVSVSCLPAPATPAAPGHGAPSSLPGLEGLGIHPEHQLPGSWGKKGRRLSLGVALCFVVGFVWLFLFCFLNVGNCKLWTASEGTHFKTEPFKFH